MVDVVVVGAGVNGLCVAAVLRERGLDVEIWARDDSMATVSAVAGAIWYPFLAEPRERVLGWSAVTFRRLAVLAGVTGSGVRMAPVVEVFADEPPEPWWRPAVDAIERVPLRDVPAPHRAALRTIVPIVDVPVHLPWLRAQVEASGVRFVTRTVRDFGEVFAVARTVVNCAGLGARELAGDASVVPVRGQVIVVAPRRDGTAWLDETTAQPFYVIPREADVVLGGTVQHGDDDPVARADDSHTILAGIAARLPFPAGAVVRAVKVGLRPYRPTVRLEAEVRPEGRLVHDYGHGGSGWTLAWGCAAEVAGLVAG
jgi:D-amino-acid oxidase